MYRDDLPSRVRAVVIGGGIHGVAVLHDLVSRGWRDVILLEAERLGSGASSRTQKFAPLIPGSSEAWSVTDAKILAREGARLANLLPSLCSPSSVDWRMDAAWKKWCGYGCSWILRAGQHCRVSEDGLVIDGYRFDDLGLVRRSAQSAKMLGGQIAESTQVTRIEMDENGWQVHGFDHNKKSFQIGALFVVNCGGKYASSILETSGILPSYNPAYVHEIYLVVDAPEFAKGLVWQSANSFPGLRFAIPWHKVVVVGPWRFETDTPHQLPGEGQITKGVNRLMTDIKQLGLEPSAVFSGFLRQRSFADPTSATMWNWAPRSLIGEMTGKRGSIFTLYGGAFLNFRHYAREIGDRVMARFGEHRPSLCDTPQAWLAGDAPNAQDMRLRFELGGMATDNPIQDQLNREISD